MTPLRLLLRDARLAAGLSQTGLAQRVAASSSRDPEGVRVQIAQYERERGGREPREALAAAVLSILGLDLSLIPRTYADARKKIA